MDDPKPTVAFSAVQVLQCPHCEIPTVQVAGGSGIGEGIGERACLQCIADGGTCCSLAPLNRWKE